MLAADPGVVELDAALVFAPAPGCREPGTLLIPALEGSTLPGCEEEWPGVAWWMLNCGGLAAYGCCGCCWYASGVYCKGGALDGRRAWARRGVVYCCESGAGGGLAIANLGGCRGQGTGVSLVGRCAGGWRLLTHSYSSAQLTLADHVGVSRMLKSSGDISARLFTTTTTTTRRHGSRREND